MNAELVILGAIGLLFAVVYGIGWLYITLGWIAATGCIVAYVAAATVTTGAAGRIWEPEAPDDRVWYHVFSATLWPVFWIIVFLYWWFRKLYRLGAGD